MRKATEAEVKQIIAKCIETLEREIARREAMQTISLISFAKGYVGTDDIYRGIQGLDYLPFEIINFCFEKGNK